MRNLNEGVHSFPSNSLEMMKNGMNIQEAIRSGKPFRRKGWADDGIFAVYKEHDIVLTLETDPCIPIELDVQDILADDWYTREHEIRKLKVRFT